MEDHFLKLILHRKPKSLFFSVNSMEFSLTTVSPVSLLSPLKHTSVSVFRQSGSGFVEVLIDKLIPI